MRQPIFDQYSISSFKSFFSCQNITLIIQQYVNRNHTVNLLYFVVEPIFLPQVQNQLVGDLSKYLSTYPFISNALTKIFLNSRLMYIEVKTTFLESAIGIYFTELNGKDSDVRMVFHKVMAGCSNVSSSEKRHLRKSFVRTQ